MKAVATSSADHHGLARPLFSPHARSAISHLVHRAGQWKGTRHGVKVEIRLSAQPDLEGKAFEWRARILTRAAGYQWQDGVAGSVFDALRDIEHEAERERRQ